MISNANKQVYLLLTVAFVMMTLGFSFNFIDFNHAKNAVLGFALIVLGLRILVQTPPTFIVPKILIAALPVLLLSVLIHGGGENTVTGYLVRSTSHYLLSLLFLLYFVILVPRDDRTAVVSDLLIAGALVVSVTTWIQFFNLVPTLFPTFPQYDQKIYSVFGNQNLLGGFIALAIPILVYRVVRESKPKTMTCLMLGLLCATCLVSGSRSAWLAALIGSACVIPYRSMTRTHHILGGTLLLSIVVTALLVPEATTDRLIHSFTDDDAGFHTRIWIWSGSLLMLKDHLLFGVGPGMFQYWSPQYLGDVLHTSFGANLHPNEIHTLQAHSTPLDLMLEFGLAGAACCVAWVVMILKIRKHAMWGSTVAVTMYASINTITHSTPHLLAALLLCVSLSSSPDLTLDLSGKQSRILTASLVALIVLPLLALFGATTLYPSHQLAQARQSFASPDDPETTLTKYRHAAENAAALSQTHLEYGLLLLSDSPEMALDELSTALSGIDTGEVYLALGQASELTGDREAALRFTEQAIYRWPEYYPGWEQSLSYHDTKDRERAFEEAGEFLNGEQYRKLVEQFGSL